LPDYRLPPPKTRRERSRCRDLGIASDIIAQQETARKRGLEQGLREGRAEGLEKGLEKGRQEERVATAKRLRDLGVATDIIAQATGLTPEQVKAL
jgi:predicted transposase/invertase (TIGR01784 family)